MPRPSKKNLLKNKTIPFIYRWTQKSTGMWYIGSRTAIGCHPDDGYICSSEIVRLAINAEPVDWYREILLIGEDPIEVRLEERRILTELNARMDSLSYNKTNAEADFVGSTKGTTCINDGTNERFVSAQEIDQWLKLGWTIGRAKIMTTRISNTMIKVRAESEDWGSSKGSSNNLAKKYIFISPEGKEYFVHGKLTSFCEEHGLSQATVEKSLKEGWIARRGRNAGWRIKDLDTGRETTRDTLNHGESHSGENNPYYGGKKIRNAKLINTFSEEDTEE
jgi:hypothetical protein